eukprot:6580046-Pyramimonas_sp.AAC.1
MVGRFVTAGRTVVAGCSFADLLLCPMIMPEVDATLARFPSLKFGVVVDDVQMMGLGTERFCLRLAPQAAHDIMSRLQHSARLPLHSSPNELSLLASD